MLALNETRIKNLFKEPGTSLKLVQNFQSGLMLRRTGTADPGDIGNISRIGRLNPTL